MKAKELAEILLQDPERLIVLSSDEEGNDFSILHNCEKYSYDLENRQIGLEELTEELKQEGYGEEDVVKDGVKAFVLWP